MPLNESAKAKLVAKSPYECRAHAPGKELKLRYRRIAQRLRRIEHQQRDLRDTKPLGPDHEREIAAKLAHLETEARGLREDRAEIERAALSMEW